MGLTPPPAAAVIEISEWLSMVASLLATWLIRLTGPTMMIGDVASLTIRALWPAICSIELVPVAVIVSTELWVVLMVVSWLAIWLIRLLAPCIVMVVVSSLLIRASWPAPWRIELVPVAIIEISE